MIIAESAENPKISTPKLAILLQKHLHKNINPQTIRNVLNSHKIHGRVTQKSHGLVKVNRPKHCQTCLFGKMCCTLSNVNLIFWDSIDKFVHREN